MRYATLFAISLTYVTGCAGAGSTPDGSTPGDGAIAVDAALDDLARHGHHDAGDVDGATDDGGIVLIADSVASIANPGAPKKLPHDVFFGFNSEMSSGASWTDTIADGTSFAVATRKAHPQILRYPGGTVANYFHWQTGMRWLGYGAPAGKVNTLGGLKQALAVIGNGGAPPEITFVVNMLTRGDQVGTTPAYCPPTAPGQTKPSSPCLDDQIAMLHAAELSENGVPGIPVRYVELGNELYGKSVDSAAVFGTDAAAGARYGAEAKAWLKRLHQEFPAAKLAVVADNGGQSSLVRTSSWNASMLGVITAPSFDAMVVHEYPSPGLERLTGIDNTDAFIQAKQDVGFNQDPHGIDAVMLTSFERVRAFASTVETVVPTGAEVWFTETNLDEEAPVVIGSWAHALTLSNMTLGWLLEPKTGLTLVHGLQSGEKTILFRDDQGLVGYPADNTPGPTIPFGLSGSGWLLDKWQTRVAGAQKVWSLAFSSNPSQSLTDGDTGLSYAFPALVGAVIDQSEVVLLNVSPSPHVVDVSALLGGAMITRTVCSMSGDPVTSARTLIVDPDAQVHVEISAGMGALYLPPYSLATLAAP